MVAESLADEPESLKHPGGISNSLVVYRYLTKGTCSCTDITGKGCTVFGVLAAQASWTMSQASLTATVRADLELHN